MLHFCPSSFLLIALGASTSHKRQEFDVNNYFHEWWCQRNDVAAMTWTFFCPKDDTNKNQKSIWITQYHPWSCWNSHARYLACSHRNHQCSVRTNVIAATSEYRKQDSRRNDAPSLYDNLLFKRDSVHNQGPRPRLVGTGMNDTVLNGEEQSMRRIDSHDCGDPECTVCFGEQNDLHAIDIMKNCINLSDTHGANDHCRVHSITKQHSEANIGFSSWLANYDAIHLEFQRWLEYSGSRAQCDFFAASSCHEMSCRWWWHVQWHLRLARQVCLQASWKRMKCDD